MKYQIMGDNLQVLVVELFPREMIYAAVGALYHIIVKRSSTGGRPIALRDAKKLDKEGKFEEAE